jgi:hypothetical protein
MAQGETDGKVCCGQAKSRSQHSATCLLRVALRLLDFRTLCGGTAISLPQRKARRLAALRGARWSAPYPPARQRKGASL